MYPPGGVSLYPGGVVQQCSFGQFRTPSRSRGPHSGDDAPLREVIPVAYNRLAMLTGYIAPDQHFIACPNQDVAYGAGFFDPCQPNGRDRASCRGD